MNCDTYTTYPPLFWNLILFLGDVLCWKVRQVYLSQSAMADLMMPCSYESEKRK